MKRSICFTILIILFNCTVCYSTGQEKDTLNKFVSEKEIKQIKSQVNEEAKKIYEQEKGKRPVDEIVDEIVIKSMMKGNFSSIADSIEKGDTAFATENLTITMQLLKENQIKTKYSHYGKYLSFGYTLEAMIENEQHDYVKSLDSFKRAIKECPDTKFFETWFQGGYALYGMERFKESVTFLTKALESNPDKVERQRALNIRVLAAARSSDNDLMTKVAYPDSKALIAEDKNTDSKIYYIAGLTASMVAQFSSDKATKLIAANDCIAYLSKLASSGNSVLDPDMDSKITQCRACKKEVQLK